MISDSLTLKKCLVMNLNNTKISFSQKYETGQILRVGDILRVFEPDENFEELFAIYTWVSEINSYLWLTEKELFDYVTIDFNKNPDEFIEIFMENAQDNISSFDNQLQNAKYIGNIENEKIRAKLNKAFINDYIHLYEF